MTGRCNWAVAATHASPSPALCALQPCTWLATDPWFFGISPSHILYFSLSYFVFLWFIFCISLFHILYFEIHYLFSFSNFVLIVFWIVGACALTGLLCPTTLHLAGTLSNPWICWYFSMSYFVFLHITFFVSLFHIIFFWDSPYCILMFCICSILNFACMRPHQPCMPHNSAHCWHPTFDCSTI